MGKAISFFIGLFFLGMLFSGMADGNGGVVATKLTQAMGVGDTTIHVSSTNNYLSTDFVYIGDEQILYSGKTSTTFTGCTRGYNNTTATVHTLNAKVYNQEANIVNTALGINISAVTANSGLFGIAQIPIKFFTHALPNMIQMNFAFFQGDMAILGYLFMACSAGFVIALAMGFLWVAAGIIKIF
jgi:hypothetical protein